MKPTSRKLLYFIAVDSYFLSHRLPLALGAMQQGYEVHLATVVTSHREAIEKAGIKVWPLTHLKRGHASLLDDIKGFWEVYKIFGQVRPDIMHAVAMKPVVFGSIAATLRGVPRQIYALGGLGYLFISESLKARIIRPIVKTIWRLFLRGKNKTLIVQNQDDFDIFVKQNILTSKNLALIKGSGVDLKTYKPAHHKNTEPKITLVARMLWDKGVGETVEACKQLYENGFKFKLILCGDIDPENPATISNEQMQEWSALDFIEWKGHVKNVADIYYDSDIAVLPSYREGLPKSLLEAAASALPIVTTDTSGCRDVVIEGKTGVLVPVQSVQPLVLALQTYIENPDLRKKHGLAGRKFCKTNFSVDKVVKSTLDLYKY